MSGNDDLEAFVRTNVGDDVDFHDTTNPDEIFHTTRAQLELALRDYNDVIKAKYRWMNAIILFITALSVVLVADFEQTLGISPTLWSNLFLTIAMMSLVFCVFDGVRWLKNKENENTDAVMRDLRRT